jgi:hypothetical protein
MDTQERVVALETRIAAMDAVLSGGPGYAALLAERAELVDVIAELDARLPALKAVSLAAAADVKLAMAAVDAAKKAMGVAQGISSRHGVTYSIARDQRNEAARRAEDIDAELARRTAAKATPAATW